VSFGGVFIKHTLVFWSEGQEVLIWIQQSPLPKLWIRPFLGWSKKLKKF